MKLTTTILFVILSIVSVSAFSQFEKDSILQVETGTNTSLSYLEYIDIHIMPLFVYNPRIRVGTEFKSSRRLSYCLDIGYANGLIKGPGYTFLEIRPEVKYYFYSPVPKLSWYASIELFYISMSETRYNSEYTHPDSTNETFFEKAQMSMINKGFHFKGGINYETKKRFSFEYYLGVGLGFRTINYSDLVNPYTPEYISRGENFPPLHSLAGDKTVLHFTLGVKIGYLFWKSNN